MRMGWLNKLIKLDRLKIYKTRQSRLMLILNKEVNTTEEYIHFPLIMDCAEVGFVHDIAAAAGKSQDQVFLGVKCRFLVHVQAHDDAPFSYIFFFLQYNRRVFTPKEGEWIDLVFVPFMTHETESILLDRLCSILGHAGLGVCPLISSLRHCSTVPWRCPPFSVNMNVCQSLRISLLLEQSTFPPI